MSNEQSWNMQLQLRKKSNVVCKYFQNICDFKQAQLVFGLPTEKWTKLADFINLYCSFSAFSQFLISTATILFSWPLNFFSLLLSGVQIWKKNIISKVDKTGYQRLNDQKVDEKMFKYDFEMHKNDHQIVEYKWLRNT